MTERLWYLGIDPGKTGAVCRIHTPAGKASCIEIFDWDGIINTAACIRAWNEEFAIHGAFLEDVHNFPHDGSTQAFRFGRNFGAWQGILTALEIPLQLASPRQWRKNGIYTPGDRRPWKTKSLDAARRLFPEYADKYFFLKQHHDRAEAALIAYQCERFFDCEAEHNVA